MGLAFISHSQGRMIINNDAFVVMTNGTVGNPTYIVLDNPASNAMSVAGLGGNLVSENEYHVVRWNIGGTTGAYNIPYYSTTGGAKIPFVLQKTTAGTGGSNIDFSTYPTPNNNLPWPSTVTHFNSAQTGLDNSLNAIDRFWLIKANSYTNRPDFNMTFNYDVAETGGANTIALGDQVAQRFNSSTNTWNGSVSNSSLFFGVDNAAQTRVESASGPGTELWEAWTLVNNSTLLPVDLIHFDVNCESDKALITWTTASESNSSHFEIEKSLDGINYTSIGQVDAAGNSSQNINYSFVDPQGAIGTAYYRLKQFDHDGQFKYFAARSLKACGNEDDIQITSYNDGHLEVIFNLKESNEFKISLYDMGGKLVSTPISENVPSGQTFHKLKYDHLSGGIYMLVVSNPSQVKTKKIVIQK